MFQHTAARRRLAILHWKNPCFCCFNTQPPEGGWQIRPTRPFGMTCFNTQPPEGGWVGVVAFRDFDLVSTHSRPKAAGSS